MEESRQPFNQVIDNKQEQVFDSVLSKIAAVSIDSRFVESELVELVDACCREADYEAAGNNMRAADGR